MIDPRIEKWRRWLPRIRSDLLGLVQCRDFYRELYEVVAQNPLVNVPNPFFWYLAHTHSQTLVIGMRRHTDKHKDAASLANLASEVVANASLVGRDFHLALHQDPDIAERTWRNLTGGNGVEYPIAMGEQQRDAISRVETLIGPYADRRVAHLDKAEALPATGTFNDLWAALDSLGAVLDHLSLLLTARTEPFRASPDPSWVSILEVPWRRMNGRGDGRHLPRV